MKQRGWPRISRDTALFLSGLALTINEAVFRSGAERPSLLMLFAGMMGLPVFLRHDESNHDQPSPSEPPPMPPLPPLTPPPVGPSGFPTSPEEAKE